MISSRSLVYPKKHYNLFTMMVKEPSTIQLSILVKVSDGERNLSHFVIRMTMVSYRNLQNPHHGFLGMIGATYREILIITAMCALLTVL